MQGANACHTQFPTAGRGRNAANYPGISGLNDFAASSKYAVFGSY